VRTQQNILLSTTGIMQTSGATAVFDAFTEFEGKAVWIFFLSAVAFATVLNFIGSLRQLGSAVETHVRLHQLAGQFLDTIVHRAALREIARPSPADSLAKVQSAIDWYKAPQPIPGTSNQEARQV
jgi:hypothetical protein